MTMSEWAKNEIDIAIESCKNDKTKELSYMAACYKSAYKAFKSLCNDGHSGISIQLTASILNNLIEGNPITPIEDTPDIWEDITDWYEDNDKHYQCKRMFSLFKTISKDSKITYHDTHRILCIDDNTDNTYHMGLISDIIDEMFPITMPYTPEKKPYKVHTVSFYYPDNDNTDFNTIAIDYCDRPSGDPIQIGKYFKESNGEFVEIDIREYLCRMSESNIKRWHKK